jgi:hypothetical protein
MSTSLDFDLLKLLVTGVPTEHKPSSLKERYSDHLHNATPQIRREITVWDSFHGSKLSVDHWRKSLEGRFPSGTLNSFVKNKIQLGFCSCQGIMFCAIVPGDLATGSYKFNRMATWKQSDCGGIVMILPSLTPTNKLPDLEISVCAGYFAFFDHHIQGATNLVSWEVLQR